MGKITHNNMITGNLFKLATEFRTKLAQVFSKTYKDLVQLNNLTQVLPMDPYGEKDANLVNKAKDLAKAVSVFVDRVYRKGASASEMQYFLGSVHSKLSGLMLGELDESSRLELAEIKKVFSRLVPVDMPAQLKQEMTGQTYHKSEPSEEAPEDIWTGQSVMPEDPAKLKEVVDRLVEQSESHDPSKVVDWK